MYIAMAGQYIIIAVCLVTLQISTCVTGDDSPCHSTNCQNGGTCIPIDDTAFTCNCHPGYAGKFCQFLHVETKHNIPEGDSVVLLCYIRLDPPLTEIQWYKIVDNMTIPINTFNTTKYTGGTLEKPALRVNLVDFYDSGEYRCTFTTNETDEIREEFHFLRVEGVQILCSGFDTNTVTLNYFGVAKQVIYKNYNGSTCPFQALSERMNHFTTTFDMRDNGTKSTACRLRQQHPALSIYDGQIRVRTSVVDMDFSTDLSFDVRCVYTFTVESNVTTETEEAEVNQATVKKSGKLGSRKSNSTFAVGLTTMRGGPIRSGRLGLRVRFKAVMTESAPGEFGFRVSNCEVFSDDKTKESSVLVDGCGTGWPFQKTHGFNVRGKVAYSPIFKLFRIKRNSKLNIKCLFHVCNGNCDGNTCKP